MVKPGRAQIQEDLCITRGQFIYPQLIQSWLRRGFLGSQGGLFFSFLPLLQHVTKQQSRADLKVQNDAGFFHTGTKTDNKGFIWDLYQVASKTTWYKLKKTINCCHLKQLNFLHISAILTVWRSSQVSCSSVQTMETSFWSCQTGVVQHHLH